MKTLTLHPQDLSGQRGSVILVILAIAFLTAVIITTLVKHLDRDMGHTERYYNKSLAANAAETAFDWISTEIAKNPYFIFTTHDAAGTPVTDSCGNYTLDSLTDNFGPAFLYYDSGWLVRESDKSGSMSGAAKEKVKIKVTMPDDSTILTEIQAKIDDSDSITLQYTSKIMSAGSFSFFGEGNMDLGWRHSDKVSGPIHINGNLYIGCHESATNKFEITSSSIAATGGIYRYKNSYSDLIAKKQDFINNNKMIFADNAGDAALLTPDFSYLLNPGGQVLINGVEMVYSGPTSSDDVDNAGWNTIVKKWGGAVKDHVDRVEFGLVDTLKKAACQGQGAYFYYQKLQDLIDQGKAPLDKIFNSSYGHYNSGGNIFRKGDASSKTLGSHIGKFVKTANPFENWYGGCEGGQWVDTRSLDLSKDWFYQGKEHGTFIDAGNYNLILMNASLLLYPLTIKTKGEVYVMGDYNVGIPHTDVRIAPGGTFEGCMEGTPDKCVDKTKVRSSAVIADSNRIWFLSFDWVNQNYGHVSGGKKGLEPLSQRKPRKRPGLSNQNIGTYVGVFVNGAPRQQESFWLQSRSHGSATIMLPTMLEDNSAGVNPENAGVHFWGSLVFLQNGVIDTSGTYGDGRDQFTMDSEGTYKQGEQSITYNGKIPPAYADSWHTYPLKFGPRVMHPPGIAKSYRLMSVKQK